jgi:hypothetical protein
MFFVTLLLGRFSFFHFTFLWWCLSEVVAVVWILLGVCFVV